MGFKPEIIETVMPISRHFLCKKNLFSFLSLTVEFSGILCTFARIYKLHASGDSAFGQCREKGKKQEK